MWVSNPERKLPLPALVAGIAVVLALVLPAAAQADGGCVGFDYRVAQNRTVNVLFRCTGTLTPAYVTQVTSGPSHGTLGPIDPITYQAVYTPDPTYLGTDVISFVAIDGSTSPPGGQL